MFSISKCPGKLLFLLRTTTKDISLDLISLSSSSYFQKVMSLLTVFHPSSPFLSCLFSDLHQLLPTWTSLTKCKMLSSRHPRGHTAMLPRVFILSSESIRVHLFPQALHSPCFPPTWLVPGPLSSLTIPFCWLISPPNLLKPRHPRPQFLLVFSILIRLMNSSTLMAIFHLT